jgi:hypothetical protein
MFLDELNEGETLVIENRKAATVCVSTDKYESIKIFNCSRSFIYVMQPVTSIEITRCKKSTIFISKSTSVTVSLSARVSITAFASSIAVVQSQSTVLFVYASTPPSISDNSRGIQLAPYNAIGSTISPTGPSWWNRPTIEIGSECSLLDPSEFLPLVLPFGDEPDGIAAPLPPSYARALAIRQRTASDRREVILEFCRKVPSCALKIQDRISDEFKRFLSASISGALIHQLDQLEYV